MPTGQGNKISNALTRKIGPLPAWAWLLGLALVLYYYRKMKGGSSSSLSTTAPQDTQSPVTLEPGESVYDPNTGELLTTPYGIPTTSSSTTTSTKKAKPKLRGKGSVFAPFGHNKPTAPKGYKSIGLGSGYWEFEPLTDLTKSKTKRSKATKKDTKRKQKKNDGSKKSKKR